MFVVTFSSSSFLSVIVSSSSVCSYYHPSYESYHASYFPFFLLPLMKSSKLSHDYCSRYSSCYYFVSRVSYFSCFSSPMCFVLLSDLICFSFSSCGAVASQITSENAVNLSNTGVVLAEESRSLHALSLGLLNALEKRESIFCPVFVRLSVSGYIPLISEKKLKKKKL